MSIADCMAIRPHLQPIPDGHHWLFADFDDVPLPMFLDPEDDPDIIFGYLVRLLPPPFHNASFYWQWSCGHGLDRRTVRAHLFFWCSEKHTDREYENWANGSTAKQDGKYLTPLFLELCNQTTSLHRSLVKASMTRCRLGATASMSAKRERCR